jgi:GNAT superfamily N-acetyltransferase
MWEAIDDYSPEQLDRHDRTYRRWARQRLRTGRLVAWVVEDAGTPVASGAVWLQDMQPHPRPGLGPTPYLLSMFTEPRHRGKGAARRIVREAMLWARREGYARMTLHASDMGRSLYARLGWKRTWEMRVNLAWSPRAALRRRTRRRP